MQFAEQQRLMVDMGFDQSLVARHARALMVVPLQAGCALAVAGGDVAAAANLCASQTPRHIQELVSWCQL